MIARDSRRYADVVARASADFAFAPAAPFPEPLAPSPPEDAVVARAARGDDDDHDHEHDQADGAQQGQAATADLLAPLIAAAAQLLRATTRWTWCAGRGSGHRGQGSPRQPRGRQALLRRSRRRCGTGAWPAGRPRSARARCSARGRVDGVEVDQVGVDAAGLVDQRGAGAARADQPGVHLDAGLARPRSARSRAAQRPCASSSSMPRLAAAAGAAPAGRRARRRSRRRPAAWPRGAARGR